MSEYITIIHRSAHSAPHSIHNGQDDQRNVGRIWRLLYVEGRRRFSCSSIARPIRDTWGLATGISGTVGNGVKLGADYDWQQVSFTGGKASSEVTGWASFRISKQFRLQVYATTGLNQASVGTSGGMALTYRFYGL
jgi:hypothetical protein